MSSRLQATVSTSLSIERDPKTYLDSIWEKHFGDVRPVNTVNISYCYPWKRRLGLIRLSLDGEISFIGLNALLQLAPVPEYVLITTIAHELTHYAHGFGSPLARAYEHPHAHGVVQRELERRGLGETLRLCDEWIDKQWFSFYDKEREMGWARLPAIYRSPRSQRKSQP